MANKVRAYFRDVDHRDHQRALEAARGCTASPELLARSRAARAVAGYRETVGRWAAAAVPLVDEFVGAVNAGDVEKAKRLYAISRVPWERMEPLAAGFGHLDRRLDMRDADREVGQDWTGWHRMEKALWTGDNLSRLAPVAERLATDVRALRRRMSTVDLSVVSIGNGAKELLDEVVTRKITGEEEVFSHTDLVDFQANLTGAKVAYVALRPLISDQSLLEQLDAAFAAVQERLDEHRDGRGFESYDTVGEADRRELARVVDGLGEPLSHLTAAAV